MPDAKINEIFSSIQGEGPYLGSKQTFVRFYGCNLSCKFCDTKPKSFSQQSLDDVLSEISKLAPNDFISITGGEPLLQSSFLRQLLKVLKQEGNKVYLETNGTLTSELEAVINYIDIVSMDFKLPSSTAQESFFSEHKKFLMLARQKEVFVKAVITDTTTLEDLDLSVNIIKEIDKSITFILQPDTNQLSHGLFQTMADFRTRASKYLDNVRIIPQMHRLAGLR